MPDTPISRYRQKVAAGELRSDSAQRLAVEKLQLLHQRLVGWTPAARKKVARGFLGFGRKAAKADAEIGGLYLYGGVGRGKSMLMDLFFEGAPVRRKRRVHFHAFMQEVHAGIHFARQGGVSDPIPMVADEVAESAALLCFDEVQVSDITDAMILGRLFGALFERGVVVVATSNRHPDDLYKDGLNRQLFLPFIGMLKRRLEVFELESPTDHRLRGLAGKRRWHAPLGPDAEAAMAEAWGEVADGERGAPAELRVGARTVVVPLAADGAARASFDDLCGAPLGPADFLAIAERFEAMLIDRIPKLSRAKNNEAKRFVTLVDALYEAKRLLICSAEAEPHALYVEGAGAFEFERTVSRLIEMSGSDWPPRRPVGG